MKSQNTFEQILSDPSLTKALKAMDIETPTPIQEKSLELIQQKNDVICQSSTGSGKTLAFAIPIAEMIKSEEKLQALVLVPTRELCGQVTEEFRKLVAYKKINILEVYGGVSIENQIRKAPNAHVIIATPGRLCDLLKRRAVSIDKVKTVVLDEADRMLDMGFIRDVEFILKITPIKRQTLMFSATVPREIEHIIHKHMHKPKLVKVEEHVDKNLLKQYFYIVRGNERFNLLVHLLKEDKAPYAIVFCGTRRGVDQVAHNLNANGINAQPIHGGLTQTKRKKVMDSFHGKSTTILVASDIASRGLDIKLLSHVYNYDVPKNPLEYVHRIGRTARAGEEGIAITLVSEKDYDNFRRIQRDRSLDIVEIDTPQVPQATFTRHQPRRFDNQGFRPKPRFSGRRNFRR